jgi:hypothetical protein
MGLGPTLISSPPFRTPAGSASRVVVVADPETGSRTRRLARGDIGKLRHHRVVAVGVDEQLVRLGDRRFGRRQASAWRALEAGDTDNAFLYTGQTAGLIDAIEPVGVVVERIVNDATARLHDTKFTR